MSQSTASTDTPALNNCSAAQLFHMHCTTAIIDRNVTTTQICDIIGTINLSVANTLISTINLCTIMRIRPHSLANNWFGWFNSNKEQCSFQVSSSDLHLSGQYSRLGLVAHGSLSHRRTFEHCWYQAVVLVAVVVVVKSYIFGHSYSKHGHKHAKVDLYALRKSSLLSRC